MKIHRAVTLVAMMLLAVAALVLLLISGIANFDSHSLIALGVGTGEHLNEGALGIHWPDSKERFARLREAVRLIKQLWTEQLVTFDGEYYHTRNATIYDRPEKPIPLYVGAGGPQVAKFAGR